MLKKLSLFGSALALVILSRDAGAYCGGNYCDYYIGSEEAESWLGFEVYATGTLYVSMYTKSNGTWVYKSCSVPSSSPQFPTYMAIALGAMNAEVHGGDHPDISFTVAGDGYSCSNLSVTQYR